MMDILRCISNKTACFLVTAKMNKFNTTQDINVKDLRLRPITDCTGTYIFDTMNIIATFLKLLSRNEFTISDTLAFPELLKNTENSDITMMFHMTTSLYSQVSLSKKLLIISYIRYIPKILLKQCVRNRFLRSC